MLLCNVICIFLFTNICVWKQSNANAILFVFECNKTSERKTRRKKERKKERRAALTIKLWTEQDNINGANGDLYNKLVHIVFFLLSVLRFITQKKSAEVENKKIVHLIDLCANVQGSEKK